MTIGHEPLTAERVLPLLRGRLGEPYLWSESCPSTQDVLREAGLPEGSLAVAEHQTAGRGRLGRRWEDDPGAALLFSLLLRPPAGAVTAQLSLVCAGALVATAESAGATDVAIKWPNDVLSGGRKLAGTLLEGTDGAVICGLGVNVNQAEGALPTDARTSPTSLRILTGREHDRAGLLADLLLRLEQRYDAWLRDGLGPLLPELERRDALRGTTVAVGSTAGTAAGIAVDGRLRVVTGDGTEALVASGEVDVPPGAG